MQFTRTLTLTTGLAAFLVTGSALAHCGSCGVGGAKAGDHHHDPAPAPGTAKDKAKGWMAGGKKGEKAAKLAGKLGAGPAAIGQPAPAFTLLDQAGNPVKLKDHEGKVVVLEWTNPGCPYVKRHYAEGTMKTLAEKWAGKGVVWLTINSTNYMDREANAAFAAEHGLTTPVLADPSGRVGKSYGAKTTPHMFVIAKDGTLAYSGAIDDDPRGEKSERVQYVDEAVRALLRGQPVPTAETKAYGCSVKYP